MNEPPSLDTLVEPKVIKRIVETLPNSSRYRFEVRIEFDAVSHVVLNVEGIVAESPTMCKPFGRFTMDWLASLKMIVLITFIDVAVVVLVVMVFA